jgi:hypothetical protein
MRRDARQARKCPQRVVAEAFDPICGQLLYSARLERA